MCRIISYLGKPTNLENLLYNPDNSFIKQSYNPKYMSYLLNLAGFGMAAWDKKSHNPKLPYIYKTLQLPFYDENLRNIARKTTPNCFLAHIRGVSYTEKQVVSTQNVHPFLFSGSTLTLAHNGSLSDFDNMRYELLEYIHPKYRKNIHGTTDSEWIYAIFLSCLLKEADVIDTNAVINAIIHTLKILHHVRQSSKITINSPVNLFISNGEFIAATRFVLDYGWQPVDDEPSPHYTYHSLWYTYGESYGFYDNEYKMKGGEVNSSIIIASEPLTEDTTTWLEVPEYTLVIAKQVNGEIKIISKDINF